MIDFIIVYSALTVAIAAGVNILEYFTGTTVDLKLNIVISAIISLIITGFMYVS